MNNHDLKIIKEIYWLMNDLYSDKMEIMLQFERVINKLEIDVNENSLKEIQKKQNLQTELF